MRQAAAFAAEGRSSEAAEVYDTVAADSGVDDVLRDVARIRAALSLVDAATSEEIRGRVGGLADADGPWRHTAREVLALSYYREGKMADADAEYEKIMADPASPAGIRSRAELMRTLIVPQLTPPATQ